MDGFCDVPGCTNETYMGWRPLTERLGKQICEYHWNRHKDPNDSFNLFDVFGFKKPASRPAGRIQKESPRCDRGRAPSKPDVKAEPKPTEPVREQPAPEPELPQEEPAQQEPQNPSGCKACGAEREAGCTYCRSCAKERAKRSNRQRQKRHYQKVQKPNAFAPELA